MNELKNCPFCGSELTEDDAFSEDGYPQMCHCIWQTNSAEKAVQNWNTRPIEDALQARIDELEKIIKGLLEIEKKQSAPPKESE